MLVNKWFKVVLFGFGCKGWNVRDKIGKIIFFVL